MNRYELRVNGVLGRVSRACFEELEVTEAIGDTGQPCTVLTGELLDQAALHGLLARIRDLGLELVSVLRLPQR